MELFSIKHQREANQEKDFDNQKRFWPKWPWPSWPRSTLLKWITILSYFWWFLGVFDEIAKCKSVSGAYFYRCLRVKWGGKVGEWGGGSHRFCRGCQRFQQECQNPPIRQHVIFHLIYRKIHMYSLYKCGQSGQGHFGHFHFRKLVICSL